MESENIVVDEEGTIEDSMRAVLRSINPEMSRKFDKLQAENDKLNEAHDDLVRSYEELKREGDVYRARVNMPLREAWLGEAFEMLAEVTTVYLPELKESGWPDKCPDCNDQREIVFTSPQGREYCETCERCGYSKVMYAVGTTTLKVIEKADASQREDGTYEAALMFENGARLIYGSEWFRRANVIRKLPKELSSVFDKCSNGLPMFTNEEDCQKVCDWINEREGYPKMERKYQW